MEACIQALQTRHTVYKCRRAKIMYELAKRTLGFSTLCFEKLTLTWFRLFVLIFFLFTTKTFYLLFSITYVLPLRERQLAVMELNHFLVNSRTEVKVMDTSFLLLFSFSTFR